MQNHIKYAVSMVAIMLSFGVAIILAFSCREAGESQSETSNPNMEVTKLFTHDGITVYRFYDGGRSVYFTDARGRAGYSKTKRSSRDSTTTENVENETVW